MPDNPVPLDLHNVGDKLSAWLGLGPSHEEIEAVAHDMIARHGLEAYEEAIRLSEVARFLGSSKNNKLYRLAAHHIKLSFEAPWKSTSQGNEADASRLA